jgi:hypothetical protein
MNYRAKVTAMFDAIRPMLVDFNPSYVRDGHDVYVEVPSADFADAIEFINTMPDACISKVLLFCNTLRMKDLSMIDGDANLV